MVKDVPPFGNYEDSDIERALEWFLAFIEPEDWKRRVERIEEQLDAVLQPRPSREEVTTHGSVSIGDDRMGWYLYLIDTAVHSAERYEPIQGSRVLPIFKRLGADLGYLQKIPSVTDRVSRLVAGERAQPDSGLFELLVALLWHRNGYTVELLKERPQSKTPDICARKGSDEWFIECKRLQKSSKYSEDERTIWLSMWAQFRNVLIDKTIRLFSTLRSM